MNLILGDAEEFRKVAGKGKLKEEKEEKRTLGLVLIRGECVVSLSVEGPPIEENKARIPPTAPGGPGIGRAAARGMALSIPAGARAAGLGGTPIRNLGGPAPSAMMPQQPLRPPGQPQLTAPPTLYPAPPRPPGMSMPVRPPGAPPGFGMAGIPPPFALRPGMGQIPPGSRPPGMSPSGLPPGVRPPGMPGNIPPPGMRPPGMPPQMQGMPPGGRIPPGMPPSMGQSMPRPPP